MIWTGYIKPYIKNEGVFLDARSVRETRYGESWPNRGWPSIGQNSTIGGWYYTSNPNQMVLDSANKFIDTTKVVLLLTSYCGDTARGYRGYLARNDAVNIIGVAVNDVHAKGTVLGMLDGHAKRYTTKAILGNPNAPYQCDDTSRGTGLWWLDRNAARLKMNLWDNCIMEP